MHKGQAESLLYDHRLGEMGDIVSEPIIIQPPTISEIIPGLFIGSFDQAKASTDKDFDAIVNVAAECNYTPQPGIIYIKISMTEDGKTPCYLIDGAIMIISALVKDGKRTLVHCHCGISRSPMIVAAFLAKSGRVPVDIVMAYVKSRRSVSFAAVTPFLANVNSCVRIFR